MDRHNPERHQRARCWIGVLGLACGAIAGAAEIDGTLDTTFNGSGARIDTNSATVERFSDAIAYANGDILALSVYDATYLHAYQSNGAIDATFGTSGVQKIVSTPVPTGRAFLLTINGSAVAISTDSSGDNALVCMSNLSGCFKPGVAYGPNFTGMTVSAANSDGSSYVLIAGAANYDAPVAGSSSAALLIRLKVVAGFLNVDTNFGSSGIKLFQFDTATNSLAGDVLVAGNRIVVAGIDPASSSSSSLYVAAFDTTGNADATFGFDGVATLAFAEGLVEAGYQPPQTSGEYLPPRLQRDRRGRIVLAANLRLAGDLCLFCVGSDENHTQIAVARLTPQGLPDASFGTGGKRTLSVAATQRLNAVSALLVDAGDRIVLGGFARKPGFDAPFQLIGLTRLSVEGGDDCSFAPTLAPPCTRVFGIDVVNAMDSLRFDAQGRLVMAGLAGYFDGANQLQLDADVARFAYDLVFMDAFD